MNELVNTKTGEVTLAKPGTFTKEQVDLLKRTVCNEATDDEFAVFLNVCQKVQLDPFAKQIYMVKYSRKMAIQTSIDGLRLIADRTGHYVPGKAPTYTYDKEGALESATAYIMKTVNGQWFEVAATAFYKEYVNTFNPLWQSKPHIMLSKCAESLALRRAFPNETSGLYTTEEMDTASRASRPTINAPRAKVLDEPQTERSNGMDAIVEAESVSDDADIEFGDPPEGAKAPPISEKQRKMVFAKMKSANIPETVLRAYIKDNFHVEHTSDLTRTNLEKLLIWIDKYASLTA